MTLPSVREKVMASCHAASARWARSRSPRFVKNSIAPRQPTKVANDSLNEALPAT
jgi:hypothetical protein